MAVLTDLAESTHLLLASRPIPHFLEILQRENQQLDDMRDLHTKMDKGKLPHQFSRRDCVLYYRQKFYVSPNSQLKDVLLHKFHASRLAGHSGNKVLWSDSRLYSIGQG